VYVRSCHFSLLGLPILPTIITAAKALGVRYDDRTRAEVIDDFRKRGIDAVPSLSPHELLKEQNDGTMKSATTAVNGTELLPLASMAGKLTVFATKAEST